MRMYQMEWGGQGERQAGTEEANRTDTEQESIRTMPQSRATFRTTSRRFGTVNIETSRRAISSSILA